MIDSTGSAIYAALNGLAARQRVIADNVANVETPNYVAGRVSFEDSLRAAIETGDPGGTSVLTTQSSDPVNPNGNNVSLDSETMNNIQTVLMYQFAAQAVNMDFNATSTALKTA